MRGQAGSHRLASLEAGRAIAALMVALYHIAGLCLKYFGGYGLDNAFRGGYSGVEYFFVLSGFIITLSHQRDIGQAGAGRVFVLKRAIRIFPMYWLVAGAMAITFALIPQWGAGIALTPLQIVNDWLLLPLQPPAILHPAWTLQREMLFYAFFALLIWRPWLGIGTMLVWQGGVLVHLVHNPYPPSSFGDMLFGVHNLGFAGGMVVGALFRRCAKLPPMGWAMAAAAAIYAAMLYLEWLYGRDTAGILDTFGYRGGTLAYIGLSMIVILGLADAERRGSLRLPGWLAALGGASYLIYLIHEPLASLMVKLLLKSGFGVSHGAIIPYLALIGGIMVVSVVLHRLVEQPVLRYLRHHLLKRPAENL